MNTLNTPEPLPNPEEIQDDTKKGYSYNSKKKKSGKSKRSKKAGKKTAWEAIRSSHYAK